MGYSPTEYAEFTEPPAEMSSHGFHRFTQILRVRFVPTEFTESTEFGSVGMAGMPYPPTSVRIRVICGRLFSARSFCAFRAFCGNLFPPMDFSLGGYGRDAIPPTSVRIRVICGRLFSARSFRAFRAFRAFCGNLFPPTDFSLGGYGILPYPRHLLWDIIPQNTPNSQNLLQRRASHGFHRFTQMLRVRCSPTEYRIGQRGYGRDAIPS